MALSTFSEQIGFVRGVVVEKEEQIMLTLGETSVVILVVLISIFVLLFFAFLLCFLCARRWHWQWQWRSPLRSYTTLSSSASRPHAVDEKVEELETPLFHEDACQVHGENSSLYSNLVSVGSSSQLRIFSSTRKPVFANRPTLLPTGRPTKQDVPAGQTLKNHAAVTGRLSEDVNNARVENDYNLEHLASVCKYGVITVKDNVHLGSRVKLEVISGPSRGLHLTHVSTHHSNLQIVLGRVPPSDMLLKDSEVSGKHALISWNSNKFRWELVDMGSLNGTFLNSQPICHPDSRYRRWSEPVELVDGDTITLGTSSKLLVHITSYSPIPFGVGVASDPMTTWRGGKVLPMEDMHYHQWPLPGVEQFGLFGIFDGHGGVGAAITASKLLPEIIAHMLSNPKTKERVISNCDATEVLMDAFLQAEAAMDHQYEGCTATVLLVWADSSNNFFTQCANVGDSACIMNNGRVTINMTEDHRVVSVSERTRLRETGMPLKDGEIRLCGLNLARMLGDKFLKEQDPRFSSKPFISQVVQIKGSGMEFALLASDGVWDVMSSKKAVQLVVQVKERDGGQGNLADEVANSLLAEARNLRTKDNASVIFLDFDALSTNNSDLIPRNNDPHFSGSFTPSKNFGVRTTKRWFRSYGWANPVNI